MQFNTILYNSVKSKNRISPCSRDQLVKQTKIIWEMPVLQYQWQRNGLAYVSPTWLISQAGTIRGAGHQDTAEHGTCWDAGADSPGASVPHRCRSPASVVGHCMSPGVCALRLLTLSDCSEGWCVSAAPESRETLHTRVHTQVYTHTHTHTDTRLRSSQPPRTAFKK